MPAAPGTPPPRERASRLLLPLRGRRWERTQRLTGAGHPDLRECALELGDSGTAKFDARVAPRFEVLRRVALPFLIHAEAADISDLPVDHDRLAVVTREPCQRTVDARRIEGAHLDARVVQLAPEGRPAA
jgi:hypothetical protein